MVVKNKANINIKIDLEDKSAADAIFAHMGLTTSAAVNMFIKRVIDDQALPFTPRVKNTLDIALEQAKNDDVERFDSFDDWKSEMSAYAKD
ncbi:type II toxin-antitoxin system RelB/DinJ family antitoxin [Streptococcus mutans]|uniref:type II toxin-antitoxin system RelB/DinJ family antitoxin n=1 Tax=Streptococcus mutans TaxID=1309 RepID=UPI0002B5C254|nr:type II toxin-antitoxin system RelB/DinJ family antitoxin [Streptococcus mutans]EMB71183.1 DNA-damage-inducible protein [Streptococcus mutans 4VF1]EMC34551.1 DNA-damage-inducible protein [Streptococcus mutans NLML1]MCB5097407.1 type II toxin-antitoxin system RelB/DinJ family antitoxin [Streptococcus mutans]MCB5117059.1 type II toxin-antitoxin system RelB/DinJ family antitoxin [Streptococcus mutans]MCY7123482.1 type II toxin-antitoxin system RelB/DinJ family antitoxin [Streptococcus mutans]